MYWILMYKIEIMFGKYVHFIPFEYSVYAKLS